MAQQNQKAKIELSPTGVFHLYSYLNSLRIGDVKSPDQLSAIAETIGSLAVLIEEAQKLQDKK